MKVKKSHFDLSHEHKLTCKADGTLYPIFCENMMPGDSFKGNTEIFARMLPLTYPVFQKFDIFTHYFFVPYYLLWDDWRKFMSPEFIGTEVPEVTFPAFGIRPSNPLIDSHADVEHFRAGSLADHLGLQVAHFPEHLPLADPTESKFSSLPFRAYQLIWNEYFRDVDLQEPVRVEKGGGYLDGEEFQQFDLLKRCWEKDYFTTARPYAQKGNPVEVAVGSAINFSSPNPTVLRTVPPSGLPEDSDPIGSYDGNLKTLPNGMLTDDGIRTVTIDNSLSLEGDGSFTIKDLRYANTMQKFLEKLFRQGSRYSETLRSIFGVTPKNLELDRPEFLGGGRQPFVISEVLQNSETQEGTPLGTFAGHGITSGKHLFDYVAPDWGVCIGLMSIMPRSSYMNVVRRHFSYNHRFDFPMPDFANIGEQEIRDFEINGKFNLDDEPEKIFGYQDRYAECKSIPSTVHGLFRSDESLKRFHAARLDGDFALNEDFVQITNSDAIDRIFSVLPAEDYDPILVTCQHNISALRPLPRRSIPKL